MNGSLLQESGWYRGTRLADRLRPAEDRAREADPEEVDSEQAARAKRRLLRWKEIAAFKESDEDDTGARFAERLTLDELDEGRLLALLEETPEQVRRRFDRRPPWLQRLEAAFAGFGQAADREEDDFPLPDAASEQTEPVSVSEQADRAPARAFAALAAPLLRDGEAQLQEGINALLQRFPGAPFDPQPIAKTLRQDLEVKVQRLVSRTVILELNIARLEERLTGSTPQERFESFWRQLRDPDVALAILLEYPVLARYLSEMVARWLRVALEFLERLCLDWPQILARFRPGDGSVLVAIKSGAGDTHQGGRSVILCRFRNGFRLVYKPRRLVVDEHFQNLLQWLNARGDHPAFRTLTVLDRTTHGWVEFVTAGPCESPQALQRFYRRQGGFLALLYVLEAVDFHLENLIASGEDPVLVDLESILHPRPSLPVQTEPGPASSLVHSVLRIGLLPVRQMSLQGKRGVDMSGLSGVGGQLTPHAVPMVREAGTDTMHIVRERVPMPGAENLPSLDGAPVKVTDHADDLVAGFVSVYDTLLTHRDALIAEEGPLAAFRDCPVRAILRSTNTYGLLLHESAHPTLLRDGLDQDRHFDHLWLNVPHQPYLSRVLPAELDDLARRDVPFFSGRPSSRDLWTSSGERIDDFFEETSYQRVLHRIELLGPADRERQEWYIRASLSTLTMGEGEVTWRGYRPRASTAKVGPDRLLAAAEAVGDRLEELALVQDEQATWVGVSLTPDRYWTLQVLGTDFYNGLSGIAVYLAYLASVTRRQRFERLARQTLESVLISSRSVLDSHGAIGAIGGFSGWGGMVYTLAHLGALWRDPALWHDAERIVSGLEETVEDDRAFDVISGTAGCMGGLLSLYRSSGSPSALEVARRCGDHLLATADPQENGIAWKPELAASRPLCGFSHGAAGIAWALAELAAATGDGRYRDGAQGALAYERSAFDTYARNWPDFRIDEGIEVEQGKDDGVEAGEGASGWMVTWCHGAPGVGLGRLRNHQLHGDQETLKEIETAVQTTVERGLGLNHSLCHGDLGNVELLLEANRVLPGGPFSDQLERITATILASIEDHGFLCGVPGGVETPGLMTGLAGIGYGLLRLAAPDAVPSVLTLQPPTGTAPR